MIISTQQQKDKGGPLYKGGPSIFYLEYFSKYEIAALAAAFAYCFSAFFGSSRTYTAPYLFIFLGLGFGICNKQEEKE